MNTFYRPEWTCGRYDEIHRVAIFYNLIEGMTYFFEDYSADVVGIILSLGKNGCMSITDLSFKSNLSEENLKPFLKELEQLHLLTISCPSKSDIDAYRYSVANKNDRLKKTDVIVGETDGIPMTLNSAEVSYSDKVGGISSLMLELTYNCNEKCIHCYNIGATRNNQEVCHRNLDNALSFDDYKRIIDEFYEKGVYKVCLTGGDPFVSPFFWDIVNYLYKRDIAVDVFTNGVILADRMHQMLKYYPRMISVSLYSDNSKVHDSITRTKGSWSKSMDAIMQLSENGVPSIIKCCIMQPNLKSYRGVSSIGHAYGIPVQFELNVTDSIDGDKCVSKNLRLTPEQLEIVLCDKETPMYVGEDANNYGEIKRQESQDGCSAGHDSFTVTPDGKLIPCCAFHLEFGNLHQHSLKEILDTSQTLKWWYSLKLSAYKECGKKEYCGFCNLCPGNNYSEHGTPLLCSDIAVH